MSEMKWPEDVPILEADDFIRGQLFAGQRACSVGWAIKTFSPMDYDIDRNVYSKLTETAKEMDAEFSSGYGVYSFNDDPRNSKQLLARIWNRAMAKLGYVVGNPEAKCLRDKKQPARRRT